MIGDAYFQLRAQVGTALFSLLRLASEQGVADEPLAALRSAQSGLRESFLFLALGPSGSGKSTLLNSLFDREFSGAVKPAAGKTFVFQYGGESRDEPISARVMACHRPDIFLRNFTVVDAAGLDSGGDTLLEDLAPYLPHAEPIFFVVPVVSAAATDIWTFLMRLGRDALKRTVVVVWQSDRVSPEEAAGTVKRLQQAMLKNLGHACPIFAASTEDRAAREKLAQWIEKEAIFSPPRRARLIGIVRLAHEVLRGVAAEPQAADQAWQRPAGQLRDLREDLAGREEQSQRQIAGVLWMLAQRFDALRQRGESLLRSHLGFTGLLREPGAWPAAFASEIRTQARESLAVQTNDVLNALETDLQQAANEHLQASRKLLAGVAKPPALHRSEVAAAIRDLDSPLDVGSVLSAELARATSFLRLPVLAALATVAVVLGALPVVGLVPASALLAAGTAAFALLLAALLRRSIVATFGHRVTANRAALLTALDKPLREACARYYAALARPLDARIAEHAAERQRHEPLLIRVEQLQQTFVKIAEDLRPAPAPTSLEPPIPQAS